MGRILITGGGTGGHLSIAKALAQVLESSGEKAVFVGSTYGQDRLWFESSNLFEQVYFLETSGVVNKKGLAKFKSLMLQLKGIGKVRKIFLEHNIKAVISVGGFSAGPASLASIIYRIPLFLHEQNAIKGRLIKLLSPFAKKLFTSFGEDLTPYPQKKEALESKRVRKEIKTIIFIGGSQGARAINNLALDSINELLNKGFSIIHQCGEKDLNRVRDEYQKLGVLDSVTLFGFSNEIINYLNKADLCVGRAGASSVWENAALGLPSIFIPYPFAAKNHQFFNAKFFTDKNLGLLIQEKDLTKEIFLNNLDSINNLESMSKGLINLANKNGAIEIIEYVKSYIK